MKYSDLVEAIHQDDRSKLNTLLKKVTTRLISFLRIHMDANKQDAEDCAQQALITALEVVKKGNLRDADHIITFMLTTCRNNYLNLVKKDNPVAFDEISHDYNQQPRQLSALFEKEQDQLLAWCIDQLSESYRNFIDYWFRYPGSDAKAVATHFDMSVNNAWTRKHRIIKKLRECYQKKNEI